MVSFPVALGWGRYVVVTLVFGLGFDDLALVVCIIVIWC